MTRKQTAGLSLALILIAGLFYFTRASYVPAGQPELMELKANSLPTLRAEFNREPSNLRIILLLSPTCPTCLEGASAIEEVLKRHPDGQITVFAVWEPMLSTDWSKPGTGALERLGDRRVRQFWDADHTVAAALGTMEKTTQLDPGCCKRRGVLWDLIAAYPPGPAWGDTLPRPTFFAGTMVQNAAGLEDVINSNK